MTQSSDGQQIFRIAIKKISLFLGSIIGLLSGVLLFQAISDPDKKTELYIGFAFGLISAATLYYGCKKRVPANPEESRPQPRP